MRYPWDVAMVTIRRNLWLRRRRLLLFGLKKSDRILDLGCGDGIDIALLRQLGYTHLTGLDISPALLQAAKKRNPGLQFIHASADKMPFEDCSFDVVIANSVMYRIGNKRVINEIHRVLVKDGHLCVIDMHYSLLRLAYNAITFSFFASVVPYLRRRRAAYAVEKDAIDSWSETVFFGLLKKNGFQIAWEKYDGLSVISSCRST